MVGQTSGWIIIMTQFKLSRSHVALFIVITAAFSFICRGVPDFVNSHPTLTIWLFRIFGIGIIAYILLSMELFFRQNKQMNELLEKQANLIKHQERLDLTIDAGGIGYWDWDMTDNSVYFNPSYYTMLGYATGELPMVLDTWLSLLHPDDKKTVVPEILGYVEKAMPFSVDFRLKCKDGSWKWISGRGKTYNLDSQGKPQRAFGVHVDINERRKAKEALVTALQEAEHANTIKSQFLANMSHEFRTPMNGIIGMSGHLLETPLSDEQLRYAKIIQECGDTLLQLINDILDFSEIDSGKTTLKIRTFHLANLVKSTVKMMTSRAQEKKLSIKCFIDPTIPEQLEGDASRIQQILIYLIDNAIKFTPKGEIVVQAVLESEKQTCTDIQFSVTDTGIGIPSELHEKIFSPLFQKDSSSTREYGGAGLGLALARHFTALMCGDIGVTSEPGVGSTFWFIIGLQKKTIGIP